jgi:hypothetical protein
MSRPILTPKIRDKVVIIPIMSGHMNFTRSLCLRGAYLEVKTIGRLRIQIIEKK